MARASEAFLERISIQVSTLIDSLLSLRRPVRRWTAFLIDAVLCLVAAWIAFALRLGVWPDRIESVVFLWIVSLLLWIPIALRAHVYRNLIRYSGARAFATLFFGCAQLAVPLVIIFGIITVPGIPRTLSILHPIMFFFALVFNRLSARFIIMDLPHITSSQAFRRRRILVYGAGRAGRQLVMSIRHEPSLKLLGFIDDDERLGGQKVDGATVWHSTLLAQVAEQYQIDEVLIAIPSTSRRRRAEIVSMLQAMNIQVRILPGIGQIIDGQVSTDDLREVQLEDLLGRDPVAPDRALMSTSLSGKTVLVTGAGGSIGSELCRQIIRFRPSRLILVEQSEFALYTIESELREYIARERITLEIIPELADVTHKDSVLRIFSRRRPHAVYHAAAYKHVPLVEGNPISGLRNNIFGTWHCALAAEELNIERFILVSTDKAVRPTNIMGASKRVCELILQARAMIRKRTVFSMVRFGNVLGSSGSVVPKFKAQIAAGGPVTLTHRNVTRYFMTIPEAAQLVLQAGSMACGGEVFVLDMGKAIPIMDLAEAMIRLSGMTVRNENNPDGDIEIVEVGLRPGEKLYEELLIGENPRTTAHPQIMQARENMLEWDPLLTGLKRMAKAIEDGDSEAAIAILKYLVPEYRSNGGGKDAHEERGEPHNVTECAAVLAEGKHSGGRVHAPAVEKSGSAIEGLDGTDLVPSDRTSERHGMPSTNKVSSRGVSAG